MNQLLVVLCIAVASVSSVEWKGGLRVRFAVTLRIGKSNFHYIPLEVERAKAIGWKQFDRPEGPLSSLVMYCPSPYPEVCGLYDDTEYVAGLQIALSKDNYTDQLFDPYTQGMTEWTTSEGVKYWTIQQYFVSEEFLATSAKERIANRNPEKMLQQDGVWVTGNDHALIKYSNSSDSLLQNYSNYTKQGCVIFMGQHYYYNMSADTECTNKGLYPWAPIYDDGQLIATSFSAYGKMPVVKGRRDWFERPGRVPLKLVIPDGPECLYDIADSPGIINLHTYFVEKPYLVYCINKNTN